MHLGDASHMFLKMYLLLSILTCFSPLYEWEGIANDSHVFYDAVVRSANKFQIPPEGMLL